MNRRTFILSMGGSLAALKLGGAAVPPPAAPEIAITMDDPKPDTLAGVPGPEINKRILHTLEGARVKAALFVTGMRIDNAAGTALIREWDDAGHMIGNHSYSHRNYNSAQVSVEVFREDLLKNEPLIRGYQNFRPFFRFPFLKEGDTTAKREDFRAFLRQHGYAIGHVTVDASDWYIDQRMRARLAKVPQSDTAPYRDYYVAHMCDRARYYRQLAREVVGRDVRHTVLVHHNLLNALCLGDVITGLQQDGWKLVDASRAFRDPIFQRSPQIVPAGESLVWALAKESGRFEGKLRYPGEDGDYEKDKMDTLGL